MNISTQPISIASDDEDQGLLVFQDRKLVAVLSSLSEGNEVAPDAWFLEAGFGPPTGAHLDLRDIQEALALIRQHLALSV